MARRYRIIIDVAGQDRELFAMLKGLIAVLLTFGPATVRIERD